MSVDSPAAAETVAASASLAALARRVLSLVPSWDLDQPVPSSPGQGSLERSSECRNSAGTMRDTVVNTATNDHDAIVVVAVGNFQSDGCIYSPGRAATSFNVGLHDLDDGVSYFSNFGSCVDAYTSRRNTATKW